MVKLFRHEETEKGVKTLRQGSSARIRRRCSRCGLEWESAHDEEACPLRELEAVFLSEDWFMVSREGTS